MHPCQELFIALEKNRTSTFTLFYEKKFHKEAIIADHLPAYFHKLHGDEVLQIFELYFQDLVKDTTQIGKKLYYDNDLELYNAINDIVDLEWMEEADQPSIKTRIQVYEQDKASMTSFKITDYIASRDESVDSMDINNPSEYSAQGLVRPLAPV